MLALPRNNKTKRTLDRAAKWQLTTASLVRAERERARISEGLLCSPSCCVGVCGGASVRFANCTCATCSCAFQLVGISSTQIVPPLLTRQQPAEQPQLKTVQFLTYIFTYWHLNNFLTQDLATSLPRQLATLVPWRNWHSPTAAICLHTYTALTNCIYTCIRIRRSVCVCVCE